MRQLSEASALQNQNIGSLVCTSKHCGILGSNNVRVSRANPVVLEAAASASLIGCSVVSIYCVD